MSPSESHVIPHALGGDLFLSGAVCNGCNSEINSFVEQPVVRELSTLRGLLNIPSRRRKRPALQAEVRFGEHRRLVRFRSCNELDERAFFFDVSADGTQVAIFGSGEGVEKRKREYELRHGSTRWTPIPEADLAEKQDMYLVLDLSALFSPFARRLAAKVALEFYCLKRGSPELVLDSDFDAIRDFVRFGSEPSGRDASLIVVDDQIRPALSTPVPFHTVLLDSRLGSSMLIVVVGLFGLIYYEVVLRSRGAGLATAQQLFLVDPQNGGEQEVRLRGTMGDPDIHGRLGQNRVDRDTAIRTLLPLMLEKFNDAIRKARLPDDDQA